MIQPVNSCLSLANRSPRPFTYPGTPLPVAFSGSCVTADHQPKGHLCILKKCTSASTLRVSVLVCSVEGAAHRHEENTKRANQGVTHHFVLHHDQQFRELNLRLLQGSPWRCNGCGRVTEALGLLLPPANQRCAVHPRCVNTNKPAKLQSTRYQVSYNEPVTCHRSALPQCHAGWHFQPKPHKHTRTAPGACPLHTATAAYQVSMPG
jgi:hypothetical protein